MTDIEKLLIKLDEIKTYPNQMRKVRNGISGLAFFPGGRGLFNKNDTSISDKEIMILGQDFDTLEKYRAAENKDEEDIKKNTTWRNLNRFLEEANIPLTNCFFTNSIMGVRLSDNASGASPGFKDDVFVKQCQDFFLFQLNIQKPKVIFVLGLRVARFLSNLSGELKSWKTINSFKNIDISEGEAIKKNIEFTKDKVRTNLVLLMHPSARHYNLETRRYKGLNGHQAQLKMVSDLLG